METFTISVSAKRKASRLWGANSLSDTSQYCLLLFHWLYVLFIDCFIMVGIIAKDNMYMWIIDKLHPEIAVQQDITRKHSRNLYHLLLRQDICSG